LSNRWYFQYSDTEVGSADRQKASIKAMLNEHRANPFTIVTDRGRGLILLS
jgi:hypothetical protein